MPHPPVSFINGQSWMIWSREYILSELLPDLRAIFRIRGSGKFFLRAQFKRLQIPTLLCTL